ncbi:MAG: hypothetical protein UV61_C0002G0142 [Candidatus Gottesmanbacteria bacterium GW2011_GWB1_43_11]|uniref:Glycosyltransferase RgtA/B/C/D-like domain-containing protein n=1 Tax=Candidatus Gottesmanbacteria bacterium GW2011_GWB1_43_11 TaxID=1618446 RepID=A0A0G1EWM5_9BACT|nr:MAG: hypothetical protein UV04_C0001G0030 [Candidatus Gottesmanbacteria bacterium GW2011_GWA2_42_16]KKS56218.1 MAG: hypothetical protein UV17_C0001G0028 [Candidatus Gottesmanbacteria bacterium GW2011_GWA1_42_26]KKS82552.1 MAG: hypothetical protein UV55_C0001G0012 [Candidatus Gottesmanbacteria bacterium GW2011_GWC1_43_10]KKS87421.1 MAG: hypothetical protein UV61_C0002G0142 [Candidatus Gottesmanbacteria bacterium GW2011_GWB1_43_11]OGG10204.1 MAG: hypothetical protein A2699_01495 [Candidatus Go
MKNFVKSKQFLAIFLFSAISRLLFLGVIPPGVNSAFWLRLPSAIGGMISIITLMLVLYKLTAKPVLAEVAGLMLGFMPWHIEQSRVISQAMLGMTILLIGVLGAVTSKSKMTRWTIVILCGVGFYLTYPSIWMRSLPMILPNLEKVLSNLSKLISVEFLFYNNDSFWWGGLRTMGAMLPTVLPFYVVGLLAVIRNIQAKYWFYYTGFGVIWLIAATNPRFPEGREFFLISPYLAFVLALGVIKVFEHIKSSKMISRVFILIYLIFAVYEQIWFLHMYTTHYAQRVKNEIPNSQFSF